MTTESLLSAETAPTDAAPTTTAETPPASSSLLAEDATANQQAEAKPEGEKPEAKAEEKAPEEYADFTAPEGQELVADVSGEVKALAKDLGLSQEKAQKVFETAAKLQAKSFEAQTAHLTSLQETWKADARADKEFGGEKFDANLAVAKAAFKAVASPKLQVLLDKSGLANHPEVIRHFIKIAPAFTEDKHVPGGKAPAGADKSAAKVLYPNNA